MTENYQPKMSQAKKDSIKKLKDIINKYDIVAAVNMSNLTAKQLQTMREKLRGEVELFMTKKRLMKIALEDEETKKKGISKLIPYLKGMPAILATNKNPFTLFKTLKKNKSSAPIKAGQEAPKDIIVPAGPTNFAPGPIIGELGACKIKAGIDAGKVAIKEDSLVAKEGEEITQKLAAVLQRLGIEPMEIGLDLVAAYEDGDILTKTILDIDEDKFMQDLTSCASKAFNLAMFMGLPTTQTISPLITKVVRETNNLAREAKIVNKETIKDMISQAHTSATNVHKKTSK